MNKVLIQSKNKIYGFSIIIGDNLENTILQTTQMSSAVLKTIAENVATDLEHFSNSSFTARLNAQKRTQTGKGSVGINANGDKGYSALSMYFQNKYNNAKTEQDLKQIALQIKDFDLKADALFDIKIPTVFNTSLENMVDENLKNVLLTNKWAQNVIQKNGVPVDGFKLLSALITAATDNAKDPILDGINCIPELNAMYITLISLGVDIYSIGGIFTHPFMLELISMFFLILRKKKP